MDSKRFCEIAILIALILLLIGIVKFVGKLEENIFDPNEALVLVEVQQ